MIFRIMVVTKMKDKARGAMETVFPEYVVYQVDKYSQNTKQVGYVFEVEADGEEGMAKIQKVTSRISAAILAPVSVQRFESPTRLRHYEPTEPEKKAPDVVEPSSPIF